MGVTTTKTNKPLNPRGNDQSPLAFNRAKLYSGKALDFDGVNDYVDLDGFTLSGTSATFSFAFNSDDLSVLRYFFDASDTRFIIGSGNTANYLTLYTPTSSFQDIVEVQTGEWYKLDISINGTSAACYLNGQLVNTLTIGEIDLSAATLAKFGSARNGAGLFYNGEASNFKIFNTALTAAQVADLYNNPEKIVPTGVEDTALKLWLPMMEGAGTTAINGAPDALGSEEVTNGDFATDSDWTKGTGWTISGGLASSDGSQSATSGLTSATISGLNNKGFLLLEVVVNSVTSGTLYATLQGTGGLDIVNIASAGTYKVLCETGDSNAQITLGASADFVGSVSSVSLKELKNCGSISGATWTHGIGSPVAQTSVIDWNKGDYLNAGGTITEILVPQGLTAGRDLLGNLFANVRKQGALNLDGSSWAEVHDNGSLDFGTGSLTFEAWAKYSYVSQGSSLNAILSLGGDIGQGAGYGRAGLVSSSSGSSMSFFYNSTGNASTSSFSDGDWVHVVGVYDETSVIVYINGAEERTTARTAASMTNTDVKQIGRDSTAIRYYNDQIAQPRIYNRALTAEEVQRNYNAGKNIYTNS